MMNILNLVKQEDTQNSAYPDEKAASTLYYVSFANALRSIEGDREKNKKQRSDENEWLREETDAVKRIPVLNFDSIVEQLKNGRCSCDALFYNTAPIDDEQHYLVEFKRADKATVLKLMEAKGNDGIYQKINDSVLLIKQELEFGGADEHEALIKRLHFFLVYAGKNNVPAYSPITMPGKTRVQRDGRGKQKSAGRMRFDSEKVESELYERFGNQLEKLGLASCKAETFPGNALPRAMRQLKGDARVRRFTMFSASDFAEVVDSGYFDDWKWGNYKPYFKYPA